ncbi:MAG: ABC transporter ATP-binding protein [Streptosporangiaceae bacterium]
MADVQLDDVSCRQEGGGSDKLVLSRVHLYVRDGELLVVVGPSGSGKTTLLRLIAGLAPVTDGEVRIGGRPVTDLPPREREVAMVFERDTSHPYLSVGRNLGLGLEARRFPREEIGKRVSAEARVLRLERVLRWLPGELSAGARRRTSLGRTLVQVPKVFLLDEPLTHLDAARRTRLRAEMIRLIKGLGTTTIWVCHDPAEAMATADRVAVLRDGAITQVDRPRVLYERPRDVFVAAFMDRHAPGPVPARLVREGGQLCFVVAGQRLALPGPAYGALRPLVGGEITLLPRPEHLHDATHSPLPGDRRLRARVRRVHRLGTETSVICAVGPSTELVATFPPRAPVRPGDTVDIAVDTPRLHIFDPVSGEALHHGSP